ncbi:hypothetical protein ANRL4_03056 [Anaerolineae bacterium]|nr:hypothetical protein ANRL4_03056 [Anaerolineae bacterium]
MWQVYRVAQGNILGIVFSALQEKYLMPIAAAGSVPHTIALCYDRQSFTRDESSQQSPDRQKANITALCQHWRCMNNAYPAPNNCICPSTSMNLSIGRWWRKFSP